MTFDAIVIGAGFAGLSAATALAERGARVLVLEARPTLGGRATAFTDPATGERVDNGQHVLFGCYDETFRFLRRIGAAANVHVHEHLQVDFVDRAGRASRLACPRLPAPLNLLVGVMRWQALDWRDRLAVLRMRGAIPTGGGFTPRQAGCSHPTAHEGPPYERGTVRDWLYRQGQTPRLVELLWEPLAVAALNQPIDTAAAAPFLQVLGRMFTGHARNAAPALAVKPLDEAYAVPARVYLERRGSAIRTGATARIRLPHVVAGNDTLSASVIICAAPWYALASIFPDAPAVIRPVLDRASRTAASPIVTVNLWFDRVVTDSMFVGLPGRTMQWVFDKRTLFGEQASHLSVVSSGARAVVARSNQELIELAVREVTAALPAARAAAVVRAVVVREKRATFSVAPGQPPRPSTDTGIPGLFLAGDWIDTGLPATIEGAVVSGHMAADMAAAYLRI